MLRPAPSLLSRGLVFSVAALAAAVAGQAAAEDAPDAVALAEVSLVESGWQDASADLRDAADEGATPATLLVDLQDGMSDADIRAFGASLGVALIDTTDAAGGNIWIVAGDVATLEAARAALTGRAEVESVEPNFEMRLFDQQLEAGAPAVGALASVDAEPLRPSPGAPNDPMYKSQWHFNMVRAEGAWARTHGEGVVVAVVDTGVSPGILKNGKASKYKRVPDLKETELVPGFNFVNNTDDPSDGNGHGTHVAGTIAQSTNNAFGVAGLAPNARIMPIKVLSDGGSGTVADIVNGIRFAADNGAKVINMSLGGGMYSASLANAVAYAHKKGVVVACAAGNGGRQKVEYPAAYSGAFAVSALGPDGKLAFYSSYGKETDIAAPGGDTRVDLNKDGLPDGVLQDTIARGDPTKHGFFPFQGTSMATPHVAAAAALVMATGVTDPDRVEKILQASAQPMNDAIRYGAGGLDVAAATKAAATGNGAWSLGLAALLTGVAVRAARRKDGAFHAAHVTPGLVAGVVAGASGLFMLTLASVDHAWLAPLATPVLEWPALAVGPAAFGMPLWTSALLPVASVAVLYGVKRLAPALAGFAFGVAGYLLGRALLGSVDVAWIPGHGAADAAWLVTNGLVAAAMGRVLLMRRN